MEAMTASADEPFRVVFVCTGNICRSPMADVVFRALAEQAGLAPRVISTSAGTGDWHVGRPMDQRAARTLADAGYDGSRHRAQTFDPGWHDRVDLVLAMDAANLHDVGGRGPRTALFGDLDPEQPGAEVPDPYYGGDSGFEEVLRMIERTSTSLVAALGRELPGR